MGNMRFVDNFEKAESHPNDYYEYTFKDFLAIQKAAQEVADSINLPVYLVGSSLSTPKPRDIDIAILLPETIYKIRFKIEDDDSVGEILNKAFHATFEHVKPLHWFNFEKYKLDIKVMPDTWFPNKERVILAMPKEKPAYYTYDSMGPSPTFGGVS